MSGAATEPADRRQGIVFPGEQKETWTWDDAAQAWYFHRFYDFQPDLNWSNPQVRRRDQEGHGLLAATRRLRLPRRRRTVRPGAGGAWRRSRARRTSPSSTTGARTCSGAGRTRSCCARPTSPATSWPSTAAAGPTGRTTAPTCCSTSSLQRVAVAGSGPRRGRASDRRRSTAPPRCRPMAQWAHVPAQPRRTRPQPADDEQRNDVFRAFAPHEDMQIFSRGIRRRLAPMLGGDRRRMELAYSLMFSWPGTPDDPLRRGNRHGRGSRAARPQRHAHADAMGRQRISRLQLGAAGSAATAGRDQGALRCPAGERPRSAARPGLAAAVVRRAHRDAAGMPARSAAAPARSSTRTCRPRSSSTVSTDPRDRCSCCTISPTGRSPSTSARSRVSTSVRPRCLSDGPYPPPPRRPRDLPLNGYGYRWLRLHG